MNEEVRRWKEDGHEIVIMRRQGRSFWAVVDGVAICEDHPRTHRSYERALGHARDWLQERARF